MDTSRCTGIFVLILLIVPSVHLLTEEDEIVVNCIAEAKEFGKNEKHVKFREPPSLGKSIKIFQREVFDKGLRQRPFECITREIEGSPGLDISTSTKYQELVEWCEAKQKKISCDPDRRTLDGTCNNEDNEDWGSLFKCLNRLLPQNYDGPSGLRKSVCGGPLPSPRKISLSVHEDQDQPSSDVTHIHTLFGQLLAHDVTDVPETFVCDKLVDCCTNPSAPEHPLCAVIILGTDDPFYKKFNKTCLHFSRAAPCDTCSAGKRNQINQASSYIDLSVTYGLTDVLAKCLRAGGWKLKTQDNQEEELMPADCKSGICGSEEKNERCFLAGDRRVNEQTHLMSLHTLFVREHNRLEEGLRKKHTDKSDEFVFQLVRDINIAQMQTIVYNEFLPPLIGSAFMTSYDLTLQGSGCTTYDPSVDATIIAEFNTAAFRLHSMINGILINTGVEKPYERLLRNAFEESSALYEGRMGILLEGVSRSPAQKSDRFVSEDLTNFLYKTRKEKFGSDLASINIQRGRDNGLPTYVDVVEFLTGTVINDFNDLLNHMSQESVNILEVTYCDVKDIDLWVGMLNEKVPTGMLVGPTSAEIIAIQFSNLKKGDRFYFEHCNGKFTNNQLDALRKVTLSSLLCLNTDIDEMQLNAMKFPSATNLITDCDSIPKLDSSLF